MEKQTVSESVIAPTTQENEIEGRISSTPQAFLFIAMTVVTILSLSSTGYFAYRTQKLKNELVLLRSGQNLPQKTINESNDQTVGSPLVWSNIDLSEPNNYFTMDVTSFMSKPIEELSCLGYEGKDSSSLSLPNLSSVKNDANLTKLSKEIEARQFSDEQIVYSENGQKSVLNAGKKSNRTITYRSVCRSNGLYFFMIDTSTSETGLLKELKNGLGM